jgi:hypothetical protein
MFNLAYISSATTPLDDEELQKVLTRSRFHNRKSDVTGFLLYKDGRFLQFLEGPELAVRNRMSVITADSRHRNIAVLLSEAGGDRQFPRWTMGYEPVDGHASDLLPAYQATVKSPAGSAGSLVALRQLVSWFQARAQAATA